MKTPSQTGENRIRNVIYFCAVLTALLLSLYGVNSNALAQELIQFQETEVDSDFPNSVTFTTSVQSSGSQITSAKLHYSLGIDAATTIQIIDVDPSDYLELEYTWDTSSITNPPSTPIVYYWEVVDSNGLRTSSEKQVYYYDDDRFNWQIQENDYVAVWWHDRAEAFGSRIFDIAQKAMQQQRLMFGTDPEQQIKILVYNDFDEFDEWHSFIGEWVGGQAFPSIGVTTQIVSAYSSIDYWLNDVIPHEISHLYFYQATDHPYVTPPAWLNEGIAQLNEFGDKSAALDYARNEILGGRLLPLWALTGSFGNDDAEVALAYAESLSAATFIQEVFGDKGITELLAAYKDGMGGDEAFKKSLGLDIIGLQEEWLRWMDVDPVMYPAPTAEPTLVWPTAPSYSTAVPEATPSSTSEPSPIPVSTATSIASPTVRAATTAAFAAEATVDQPAEPATSTAAPALEGLSEADNGGGSTSICGAGLVPLIGFVSIAGLLGKLRVTKR
ncbi:MAG: peptidase MA family metallohydrolase [Candidatus Promineifilaceae bacterium]